MVFKDSAPPNANISKQSSRGWVATLTARVDGVTDFLDVYSQAADNGESQFRPGLSWDGMMVRYCTSLY
jgi:hypothetical protein